MAILDQDKKKYFLRINAFAGNATIYSKRNNLKNTINNHGEDTTILLRLVRNSIGSFDGVPKG